jgi:hypothetical protein
MEKNKLPEELQKIIDKNGWTTTPMTRGLGLDGRLESQLKVDDIPTIEMKVYSFDVLGSKLYVVTQSDHVPYIQEYIDSVNNGTPDKEGVIRKYATQHQKMSESLIDRMINQSGNVQSLPIRIIGELNKIELDLKPLLDAQIRDKKIQNLLDGDISENEE